MKTNLLILLASLLTFLLTLCITNVYMSDEAKREADHANELYIQQVSDCLDVNLKVREKSVQNFLACHFRYDYSHSDTRPDTLITISDADVKGFEQRVYPQLHNFLRMNPRICEAMFIVAPHVLPGHPQGFVPLASRQDTARLDIAPRYGFMQSANYRRLVKGDRPFWHVPADTAATRGSIVSYYVPIHREDGSLFGAFAITVSLKVLRESLAQTLPADTSQMCVMLVDAEDDIILSTYQPYERYGNFHSFAYDFDQDGAQERSHEELHRYNQVHWDGHTYYVYHEELRVTPWRAITICCASAIYRNIEHTRSVILGVSLTGMLLMLLCCLFIFRRTQRSALRAAAMQSELQLAARVQAQLLPAPQLRSDRVSLTALMHPARAVGGDLYDYQIRDGQLLFCIGDVSGKGMPAALFMTQVCSLFRSGLRTTSQPEIIMQHVNDVLASDNPSMTFCTLFIGCLNLTSGLLTYCNAGHLPPVLIRAASDKVQLHPVLPNLAAGIMEGYAYRSEQLRLSPSDHLLLYTDGVTEAMDACHMLFSTERMLDALSADEARTQGFAYTLSQALSAFVGSAEQSDDITMLELTFC